VVHLDRDSPTIGTVAGGLVTEKTVAEKARIKSGTRIAVLNRVPGVVESLGNMRPLGLVGISDTWSAFRLRPGQ
jgi:hypothetical protein